MKQRPPCAIAAAVVLITAVVLSPNTSQADHELEGRDIARGEVLYQDNCAACHGINLEGQANWQVPNADGTLPAPPHDASGHTWHHDNQLLFDYTLMGGKGALAMRGISDFNSGMPAFGGVITDAEIWDVLAFIRSRWPENVQEAQASRNPKH